MPPKHLHLTGVHICRDGGSLVVLFSDETSEYTHELFFPVVVTGDAWEDRRFGLPVRKTYISGEYVSPVTGVSSPTSRVEQMPISWGDARQLLDELRPEIVKSNLRCSQLFDEMVAIAQSEGKPTDQ